MRIRTWSLPALLLLGCVDIVQGDEPSIENRFEAVVRPIVRDHCLGCHGPKKPEGKLDLSADSTVAAIVKNHRVWDLVLERVEASEMPPEEATKQPTEPERKALVDWIKALRDREASKNAGDPGPVLARRLSNAEFDNTIRDLTGVDIRPTREFPVDPANEAGFDTSGESLTMSPALLKKYLEAARKVSDHLVLKPEGFDFAPEPAVTETDRDKYTVRRIIAFYDRHQVDYAAYFLAAWRFQHRDILGKPFATLAEEAKASSLSVKYLTTLWSVLTEPQPEVGPIGDLQALWKTLPTDPTKVDEARRGAEQMRDFVDRSRKAFEPNSVKVSVKGISAGSQPIVLWNNRHQAEQHRRYPGGGVVKIEGSIEASPKAKAVQKPRVALSEADPAISRYEAAFARFCDLFPDAFFVSDRGPYFDPRAAGQGRPLTAGFHLMQGYFRDDTPLAEMVLDDDQRRELDGLWWELNFITGGPARQYKDFIFFERAEPPQPIGGPDFDFARSEDKDATSDAKIKQLGAAYLDKARKNGTNENGVEAIETYFTSMATEIRKVEEGRKLAEPTHLAALLRFAERAYRRPLSNSERDDLLAFYRDLRERDGLNHEDAIRDSVASILMSPHFSFRADPAEPGKAPRPLSDYALASRLSYFLWATMPDEELLALASKGELHKPDVLAAQARRMLRDGRARGFATEFAGHWLDFRRFEEINIVDRVRFATFTNELRQAMFEEPIRFFLDIADRDGSILDFLDADHTFVNPILANHYGMAIPKINAIEWVRVDHLRGQGRGGLLPMSVFLTANSPGLRTSPVKRGNWVVKRILGEHIPAPPPTVPELPKDEAGSGDLTLPQLLARHREDKNCASCHQRFDSIGLVFEGYGPIGERREKDLGGRPVETKATFPDGSEGEGLDGLRRYLAEKRRDDFVDNLCQKLLAYALARGLILSDESTIKFMKARLSTDGYRFGGLVETIITSPQFLNKRGRDDPRD